MREREAFRDQLQSLREQFAGQEVLTLDQSSKLLGLDRAVLLAVGRLLRTGAQTRYQQNDNAKQCK